MTYIGLVQKKKRRLLPYVPTEDPARRLEQMCSLAIALTALKLESGNELTFVPGMAPRSANQAKFEDGGMQVLSKEDHETVLHCRIMVERGEYPPLLITYDKIEGFFILNLSHLKRLIICLCCSSLLGSSLNKILFEKILNMLAG
ncbi:putative Histone-lysine N-methyltransferase ATXR5 [Silene latifolia]|uniref:putative Histone-lysine N-methyltransferase ATXR5 n=1 Tax=Silene latifolia TaxID=37657 RepID=UPI003D783531